MKNSNAPLVSIGLPVFNGEKSLRQTLDSLLAQDCCDFELIISDNASTDKTEEICVEYAARDSRIRYVRQINNLGSINNFNFVLQAARGEYFMWAAADDFWATDFIHTLLAGLENNPTAVGVFCPYQLVDEDTDVVLEGIWRCNYESRYIIIRLLKFTWYYCDANIYGLLRREHLDDIKFKHWAWINASTPYNLTFPIIYLLLTKGNFLTIGEKPLWFKSITTSHWHPTPFKTNPLLSYIAHIIRKINLLLRSLHYIYLGTKSAPLILIIFPFLLLRFLFDCITPIYAAISIWASGRKISQVSPQEVWRLGVR